MKEKLLEITDLEIQYVTDGEIVHAINGSYHSQRRDNGAGG